MSLGVISCALTAGDVKVVGNSLNLSNVYPILLRPTQLSRQARAWSVISQLIVKNEQGILDFPAQVSNY